MMSTDWFTVASLTSLLTTYTAPVEVQLRTLHLTANIPASSSAEKILISFIKCEQNRSFAQTLAALPLKQITVSFESPDCYYRCVVQPAVLWEKSLLLLACQVMYSQSRIRIAKMLSVFDDAKVEDEAENKNEGEGRTDLTPFISWAGSSALGLLGTD